MLIVIPLFGILTAIIAGRKGFAPFRWLLSFGPIGTIVVLSLPSARSMGIAQDESVRRTAKANRVGAWMCGLCLGFIAIVAISTAGWLAYSGIQAKKSYDVTIAELGDMGDKAYHSNLRVEGFVEPGSIVTKGTDVNFVLDEYESHSPKAATGHLLKVSYKGTEPPPDTFKDDAQTLVEGTYGHDSVFLAKTLQAK